jgi:hypothetical protein
VLQSNIVIHLLLLLPLLPLPSPLMHHMSHRSAPLLIVQPVAPPQPRCLVLCRCTRATAIVLPHVVPQRAAACRRGCAAICHAMARCCVLRCRRCAAACGVAVAVLLPVAPPVMPRCACHGCAVACCATARRCRSCGRHATLCRIAVACSATVVFCPPRVVS